MISQRATRVIEWCAGAPLARSRAATADDCQQALAPAYTAKPLCTHTYTRTCAGGYPPPRRLTESERERVFPVKRFARINSHACAYCARVCVPVGVGVCTRHAPHGNDESSMLEHLARSLSRVSTLPPLHAGATASRIRGCVYTAYLYARTQWQVFRRVVIVVARLARVMISRLFARAGALRPGVGKFACPRGYVFVSNDLCRRFGYVRVTLPSPRDRIRRYTFICLYAPVSRC